MQKFFTLSAAALLLVAASSEAYANWSARCQIRTGLRHAVACGATAADAKKICFKKVPDPAPVLVSVSRANCKIGSVVQHGHPHFR